MANKGIENLVPQSERTKEEQRRIATMGGIASGKARKERKTFKEELLILLSQGNTQEKISLAVLQKALDGDIKAFETIRDTVGEKPIEKTQNDVNLSYESLIKEVEDDHDY